ncbi:MAG: 5,10-methylenetetrahydrofolate reductase [Spirochaetales bacterium]|nr:MAG: 5,10-methylenetetrahydrofolate reductase [Spirochaetales bacterium]
MALKDKLEKNEFALLAEFVPPKGTDVTLFLEHAVRLKGKLDAWLVPELPGAVMRMSSLGGSYLLLQNGLEPVMEINGRDRNRLALQADLLSAATAGIKNIVAAKADSPQAGDMPETKAVNDLNTSDLLDMLAGFNRGSDFSGRDLPGSTDFTIGATAEHLSGGLTKLTEVGVAFVIAPPVFDAAGIESALTLCRTANIKIIPTVMVLKSVGMARYIQAHSDSMRIPDPIIERIQAADSVQRESIKIAREIISILKKEGCAGVLISSMGWECVIPEILES